MKVNRTIECAASHKQPRKLCTMSVRRSLKNEAFNVFYSDEAFRGPTKRMLGEFSSYSISGTVKLTRVLIML